MRHRKKHFFKRKAVWLILSGIAVFGGVFAAARNSSNTEYETVLAKTGAVQEVVTATGQIRPENSASLKFKVGGVISELLAEVGDSVKKGELLAKLEDSDLNKKLVQAEAEYAAASVAVENEKQALGDTKTKSEQELQSLYSDAVVAFGDILNLSQKAYATYISFFDSQGKLVVGAASTASSLDATGKRPGAISAFSKIVEILENYDTSSPRAEIEKTLQEIGPHLQIFNSALSSLVNAINSIPTESILESTLNEYKSSLATAKNDLNSAISKQVSLSNGIKNKIIQNSLDLNAAQARLNSAQAKLVTADAGLEIARRNVSDAYLYAPIDGVVAVRDKQIGEVATISDQIYFLINGQDLEVTANVPEVDISRVSLTAKVLATLDALGPEEEFALSIKRIDPDQTTIDGVVYYKVTFEFLDVDPRFRSGMSVNLTIVAKEDYGVVVPRRAILDTPAGSVVRVLENGSAREREVRVGLKGDVDALILSGLSAGEQVIVSEKAK